MDTSTELLLSALRQLGREINRTREELAAMSHLNLPPTDDERWDAQRDAMDKMIDRDFGPEGLDVTGPEADGFPVYVTCDACDGDGHQEDGTACPVCEGNGIVKVEEEP